jgi:hypothetical protein
MMMIDKAKAKARHNRRHPVKVTPRKLEQRGVIKYGAGLNAQEWIDNAVCEGYTVIRCKGFCMLFK